VTSGPSPRHVHEASDFMFSFLDSFTTLSVARLLYIPANGKDWKEAILA
jgi:hypothetical protein